ncbi:MAG: Sec-independent protein translocase protein TatB [Pseudomonadota bacterium]
MFDIGGVELLVVAAIAILVVGPRELPGMLRAVGRFVRQARSMTSQVQRQFNDALKEAELDDVRQTINDVRSLNPATKIKQTIAKEMRPLTDVGNTVKEAVDTAQTSASAATRSQTAAPKPSKTASVKSKAASKAQAEGEQSVADG